MEAQIGEDETKAAIEASTEWQNAQKALEEIRLMQSRKDKASSGAKSVESDEK